MATITVRNLPEDVHRELRIRAARAGRSAEAEVRAILAEACKPAAGPSASELQALVSELYGGNKPLHVVDNFILERREQAQRE
jgi:plasmid stability protein